MENDEKQLLKTLQIKTQKDEMFHVRMVVTDMGMSMDRACSILEKWAGKNWYEYGVSVMAGWLTEEGLLVHV